MILRLDGRCFVLPRQAVRPFLSFQSTKTDSPRTPSPALRLPRSTLPNSLPTVLPNPPLSPPPSTPLSPYERIRFTAHLPRRNDEEI